MAAVIMLIQALIAAGPTVYDLITKMLGKQNLPTWDDLKAASNQIDLMIATEMTKK
jgi:hypothetical protein